MYISVCSPAISRNVLLKINGILPEKEKSGCGFITGSADLANTGNIRFSNALTAVRNCGYPEEKGGLRSGAGNAVMNLSGRADRGDLQDGEKLLYFYFFVIQWA